MSLNLTFPSVSLAYSPPIAPDLYNCDELYAHPNRASLSDCQRAFQLIPSGPSEIPWFVKHRYNLPFNATYGTCQIEFYASGPATTGIDIIYFSGDDLRDMAGYVIDQCVDPAKETAGGGFITAGLANAINWVVKPDVKYDDPYPSSTTYLSLTVWNTGSPDEGFNAGDMQRKVSSTIVNAVADAAEQYPQGSPQNVNLEHSEAYFQEVLDYMNRARHDEWWGPPDHDPFFLPVSATGASGSEEATNDVGVPLLNVTAACSRAFRAARDNGWKCVELLENGTAFSQNRNGHGIAVT